MIPGASRIAFLDRENSIKSKQRLLTMRSKIAKKHGIAIQSRTFSHANEIGTIMQELHGITDLILLYPQSIKKADIPEIVKWQNKLKFPVLAQKKAQIKEGLFGGPTVDEEKTSPKLASYIHKLLHGRQPKSLPIYYVPEKTVINLKAVNILGLTIVRKPTNILHVSFCTA